MNQLARQLSTDVTQEQGLLLRREGDAFLVRTSSGDVRAKRATSCLVEPHAEDLVLIAAVPRGVCYVLAVLEREAGEPTRLVTEGDLEVSARNGRLSLGAERGVSLVSKTAVELVAARFSLKALEGSVVLEELALTGRKLTAQVDRIKAFATSLDSVMERVSQRVKRSYRTVEEADHVRAERIDYVAKRTMNLHGENAVVTAEHVVKVDGEQILVG
jgi:hypothetical protein